MSEDRDEWMEEVKTHCEGCHDNKDESSQVQDERMQEQRRRDCCEAWEGEKSCSQQTGKMMKIKANCPSDCLVTEMLPEFSMEAWFEITHVGLGKDSAAWTILRLVFLKKLDAKLEEGNRLFRAIALMSVLPKWCAVVVVGL